MLEDYDFELQYHPDKANVVADALSPRNHAKLVSLMCKKWEMMGDLNEFNLKLSEKEDGVALFTLNAQPTLVKKVIEVQLDDEEARLILNEVLNDAGLVGWRI